MKISLFSFFILFSVVRITTWRSLVKWLIKAYVKNYFNKQTMTSHHNLYEGVVKKKGNFHLNEFRVLLLCRPLVDELNHFLTKFIISSSFFFHWRPFDTFFQSIFHLLASASISDSRSSKNLNIFCDDIQWWWWWSQTQTLFRNLFTMLSLLLEGSGKFYVWTFFFLLFINKKIHHLQMFCQLLHIISPFIFYEQKVRR